MDWTTVAVGTTTALAAIAGSVGAQVVQARSTDRRDERSEEHRRWEAKRDAALNLFVAISDVEARVSGALASTGRIGRDKEMGLALLRSQAAAEMLLSPAAWARMRPFITAVSLRANALAEGISDRARQQAMDEVERQDLHDVGSVERLRAQFLEAVRDELQV